ncbi:MAG: alpha-hydroxy acid oxidase [Bacteroidota bacterium]
MSSSLRSIHEFQQLAQKKLRSDAWTYLEGGAEREWTLHRNEAIFRRYQIRPRRLVDVSTIDLSVDIFGKRWPSPIFLVPIGYQKFFDPHGALTTAKAAHATETLMIASTVTQVPFSVIASPFTEDKPWFQLYPTQKRTFTKTLIQQAEAAGSRVLVLTTDVPVLGNRPTQGKIVLQSLPEEARQLGNLPHLPMHESYHDPSMTWDIIRWIRSVTDMKIVLKGILSPEDAIIAIDHKVNGVYISNHGGRQLDSNLSTLECLGEIAKVIKGKIPIFIDGGFRRGTDIFKALALGATAVGIGRPYIYGLSSKGQQGVEGVIAILRSELYRNMQLAGVPNIASLNQNFVRRI